MLRQVTAAYKHFHADAPHNADLAGFGNYAAYYGLVYEAKFQRKPTVLSQQLFQCHCALVIWSFRREQ